MVPNITGMPIVRTFTVNTTGEIINYNTKYWTIVLQ